MRYLKAGATGDSMLHNASGAFYGVGRASEQDLKSPPSNPDCDYLR